MRQRRLIAQIVAFALALAACRGELVSLAEGTATPTPGASPVVVATGTPVRPAATAATVVPTSAPATPPRAATPSGSEPSPSPSPRLGPTMPPSPARGPAAPPVGAPTALPTATPTVPALSPPAASPTPLATVAPAGRCDLAVDKVSVPGPDGRAFIVTVTVQNRGDGTCVAGASLSELPSEGLRLSGPLAVTEVGGQAGWRCDQLVCVAVEAIPTGYAATLTYTAVVESGTLASNCASVRAPGDVEPENDRSCLAIALAPSPGPVACSFGFSKVMEAAPPATGAASRVVSGTIVLANSGPAGCVPPVGDLLVVDALPEGWVVSTVATSGVTGWSCTTDGGSVECSGPAPAAGEQVTLLLRFALQEQVSGVMNCAAVQPLGLRACAMLQ